MTIRSTQEAPANPFRQLTTASGSDPTTIRDAYEQHRSNRNAQFKERILTPGFRDWQFDEILHNVLEAEQGLSDFVDSRNNLSLWARPPRNIRDLIHGIQREIAAVAGSCKSSPPLLRLNNNKGSLGLWLAPPENLHMTTLEMMTARTASEVEDLITFLQKNAPLQELVNYPLSHHARLGRPIVSYDTSALALSFVPLTEQNGTKSPGANGENYTYHHLRSDLYDLVTQSGCQIGARYIVPSAHITIARFTVPVGSDLSKELRLLCERAGKLVEKIEDINQELSSEHWERFGHPSRGEWTVGQERALELNKGTTWYGTGNAVLIDE